MKKIILSVIAAVITLNASAQGFLHNVGVTAKIGLNVGGTAPLGLPAEIRHINSYKLQSNPVIGLDFEKPVSEDRRWGVIVGLHYENKGMEEDARVKNYHIAIVRGGESLEGQYTGNERTEVNEWMLTVPVLATWHVSDKVRLRVGPYVSFLVKKEFEGEAHEGYLRVGDPTGQRVELGNDATSWGSYDFSEDMRNVQYGISVGADWWAFHRIGFFGEVNWGINEIFRNNFNTISMDLYPIFGFIGVCYRIR